MPSLRPLIFDRDGSDDASGENDGPVNAKTITGIVLALICLIAIVCAYQYVARRKPQRPAPRKRGQPAKTKKKVSHKLFSLMAKQWVALKTPCGSRAGQTNDRSEFEGPSTISSGIRQKMGEVSIHCRSYLSKRQLQTPESRFPTEAKKRKPLKPLYLNTNVGQKTFSRSLRSDQPYQQLSEVTEWIHPSSGRSARITVQNDNDGADVIYTEWANPNSSAPLEKPSSALISPHSPWSMNDMRVAGTPLSTTSLSSESFSPKTPPHISLSSTYRSPPLVRLRDETIRQNFAEPALFYGDDISGEFVIGDDSDKESLYSQ